MKDTLIFLTNMILGIGLIGMLQKYINRKQKYFDKHNIRYNFFELLSPKFIEEKDKDSVSINNNLKLCLVLIFLWVLILWLT